METERSVMDVYDFTEIIGEGAFSTVVLGHHLETGEQNAIKIIEKAKIQSEVQRERVDREIDIQKNCDHPNIVKLIETYESDLEVCLVLELMGGGDLFDRIMHKGTFSEEEARIAMCSIFSAVAYLHDRSIVHRDLKPENLLYSSKEDSAILKVSDFGLSKISTEKEMLDPPCGTIAYLAPEMAGNKVYSKSVDIWSCGCILYFMLFGRPPFYSDDEDEIYDLVFEGNYTFPPRPFVSGSAKQLIGNLLEKDPKKRYTAKEALTHPWIMGRTLRQETILSTSPISSTSTPLSIPNIRVSLNSSIDAQRGPLTPPLTSPMDSKLWKKRASKMRETVGPFSLDEPDLSSDSEKEPETYDVDMDSSNITYEEDSDIII